jgi:hypothetical protein
MEDYWKQQTLDALVYAEQKGWTHVLIRHACEKLKTRGVADAALAKGRCVFVFSQTWLGMYQLLVQEKDDARPPLELKKSKAIPFIQQICLGSDRSAFLQHMRAHRSAIVIAFYVGHIPSTTRASNYCLVHFQAIDPGFLFDEATVAVLAQPKKPRARRNRNESHKL